MLRSVLPCFNYGIFLAKWQILLHKSGDLIFDFRFLLKPHYMFKWIRSNSILGSKDLHIHHCQPNPNRPWHWRIMYSASIHCCKTAAKHVPAIDLSRADRSTCQCCSLSCMCHHPCSTPCIGLPALMGLPCYASMCWKTPAFLPLLQQHMLPDCSAHVATH